MRLSVAGILGRVRDWYERRSALREIAGRRGIERDQQEISVASDIVAANMAFTRGDSEEALRICEHVREVQPDVPRAYFLPVGILHQLQRFEEANALIEEARARFPAEGSIARLWALSAQRCGDLPTAILRWRELRKAFDGDWAVFVGEARCFISAGRLDEADAVLSETMRRFPDQETPASDWAALAARRGDWPEALSRWQRVAEQFPGSMPALLGTVKSLREQQRYEEAEALLAARRMDFGVKPQPSIEYARLAERRRDWPEAERRWAWVHEMFPQNVTAYVGLATTWLAQQRFDEAQALLEDAMTKFPKNPSVSFQYAEVAHRRQDWPEAVRRWETVRADSPDRPLGYRRGVAALKALGRQSEVAALETEMSRRFAAKSA